MKKPKILIADDHKLIREGVLSFLEAKGEFNVEGQAADGEEALALAAKLKPDLVIIDLNMPKMGGLEAIRKIKTVLPKVKIIVLTVASQDAAISAAMNIGVDGYLLKDILPDQLESAIRTILDGKPVLHPDIMRRLMLGDTVKSNAADRLKQLTPRENEVLTLLADGRSNEEIARLLFLSIATVKTHVHNILRKMKMTHRVQAALFLAGQRSESEKTRDLLGRKDQARRNGILLT